MIFPNGSTALAMVIIDELARGGVGLVAAGPGSRSTALILAASAHPGMEVVICLDERSAGFHALGWAKAGGGSAAALTTSGTAAANLTPAVVEADLSSTRLMALTSDRPPELRRVGANQAIRQSGMFSNYLRSEFELGPAEAHPGAALLWRSTVSQALGHLNGFGGRPGPVHLNVAFREPTVPVGDDGRTVADPFVVEDEGRADGRQWTETSSPDTVPDETLARLEMAVSRARRGLILAGGGVGRLEDVPRLGRLLGWPVLATAESGLRGADGVIATGHHLVGRHQPDLIIRFGSPGPSRRLVDLVSGQVPQVVVGGAWSDPGRMADLVVDGDGRLAGSMHERLESRNGTDWRRWWEAADRAVVAALDAELGAGLSEPALAAAAAGLGADVTVVASSMPIRDVEAYSFAGGPVVANRGASGIDGFVSTALGASRLHARPLALCGDLSLLHDSNGFLCDPRPSCPFLVIDNRGGGIFSFLPQAEHSGAEFERLFATPHNRDLAAFAAFHGASYRRVEDVSELEGAVGEGWERGGISLLVAETDRTDNVAEHVRLANVAADALAGVEPLRD